MREDSHRDGSIMAERRSDGAEGTNPDATTSPCSTARPNTAQHNDGKRHQPGLESAIEHADPWWGARARAAIIAEAERTRDHGGVFCADDLRDAPYGLGEPDHPARWGAAFCLAYRDGLISPAGFTISRRRERAGGVLRVWRGVPLPTSPSEPTMARGVE